VNKKKILAEKNLFKNIIKVHYPPKSITGAQRRKTRRSGAIYYMYDSEQKIW
jgi:hypothetical protein